MGGENADSVLPDNVKHLLDRYLAKARNSSRDPGLHVYYPGTSQQDYNAPAACTLISLSAAFHVLQLAGSGIEGLTLIESVLTRETILDIVSIAALYPNSQYLNAEDVLEDPRLVIRNFLKANHYDDIDAMRDKVIQRESTEKEYKNLLKHLRELVSRPTPPGRLIVAVITKPPLTHAMLYIPTPDISHLGGVYILFDSHGHRGEGSSFTLFTSLEGACNGLSAKTSPSSSRSTLFKKYKDRRMFSAHVFEVSDLRIGPLREKNANKLVPSSKPFTNNSGHHPTASSSIPASHRSHSTAYSRSASPRPLPRPPPNLLAHPHHVTNSGGVWYGPPPPQPSYTQYHHPPILYPHHPSQPREQHPHYPLPSIPQSTTYPHYSSPPPMPNPYDTQLQWSHPSAQAALSAQYPQYPHQPRQLPPPPPVPSWSRPENAPPPPSGRPDSHESSMPMNSHETRQTNENYVRSSGHGSREPPGTESSSQSTSRPPEELQHLSERCCHCRSLYTPAELTLTQLGDCGHIYCHECLTSIILDKFAPEITNPEYPLRCPVCYQERRYWIGRIQDSVRERLNMHRDYPEVDHLWLQLARAAAGRTSTMKDGSSHVERSYVESTALTTADVSREYSSSTIVR